MFTDAEVKTMPSIRPASDSVSPALPTLQSPSARKKARKYQNGKAVSIWNARKSRLESRLVSARTVLDTDRLLCCLLVNLGFTDIGELLVAVLTVLE